MKCDDRSRKHKSSTGISDSVEKHCGRCCRGEPSGVTGPRTKVWRTSGSPKSQAHDGIHRMGGPCQATRRQHYVDAEAHLCSLSGSSWSRVDKLVVGRVWRLALCVFFFCDSWSIVRSRKILALTPLLRMSLCWQLYIELFITQSISPAKISYIFFGNHLLRALNLRRDGQFTEKSENSMPSGLQ